MCLQDSRPCFACLGPVPVVRAAFEGMTVAFAVLIDAAGFEETGGAAAAAYEGEMVFAEEPQPFVEHTEACQHPDDRKRATEMAAAGVVVVPRLAAVAAAAAEMDTRKEEAEPYRQTWKGWIVDASCRVACREAFGGEIVQQPGDPVGSLVVHPS